MKFDFERIAHTIKIVNIYLIFFALLFLCFYIYRIQNNSPQINEKKKLDEYYAKELFDTYKYNLNPIYNNLEEGFSDYIAEIEDCMRADNYNTRQIKELESQAYSKAIHKMDKKEKINKEGHED